MSIISKHKAYTLNARGRCLQLGTQTRVMGVLNLTPDSFSGDGRLLRASDPIFHCDYAVRLIHEGADLIDVGGESARPNAAPVSAEQEIKRVVPTVALLRKRSDTFISVDTTKVEVAQRALDAGADIINNIQGTRMSKSFLRMISRYEAAVVLMHSRGTPRTMQSKTRYKDLVGEIVKELSISVEKCLDSGIKSDRIIIDPGIGFAKTPRQSFFILKELKEFRKVGKPLLVGTSRKSFIGKVTQTEADDRLWGTAASVAISIINGGHIVRVHDVKAMLQAVRVADAVVNPESVN